MILFIYPSFSSFVRNDYEILKKYDQVKRHHYVQGKSLFRHISSQVKLLFWLLQHIWSSDKIYCWFADYHSFLPALLAKILGKECYVVLGGYDVTYIPEYDYGSFKNPLRAFHARSTMRLATLNLAVSNYVREQASLKVPSAKIITIFNGISIPNSKLNYSEKEDIILTVGTANSFQRIKLKGFDFFCQVASLLSGYQFIIIGVGEEGQKYLKEKPENVEIWNVMEPNKLSRFYKTAKVYCQFSKIESFGLAMVEAMAYGCIPVATNVGALPEIIGKTGFILDTPDIKKAATLIEKALHTSEPYSVDARKRVEELFSIEQREKEIIETLHL